MTRATMNTFTLPFAAAPGFRRVKMARATTNTFNNICGGGGGGRGRGGVGGGGGGASTTIFGISNSKKQLPF